MKKINLVLLHGWLFDCSIWSKLKIDLEKNYHVTSPDLSGYIHHDKKMAHSHSNSVLLEPNKSGELIWKFSTSAELYVGCNVPGHLEIGMISKININ